MVSLNFALLLLAPLPQEPPPQDDAEARRRRLRSLSIAELLEIQVYTPSMKEEPVGGVPAAVTVLTNDDLRRLGVRHVAEAFRVVPGMCVARIEGNSWAVSSRGFNDHFTNKLQVLLDGRSLYTHTFSGVLWGRTELLLEEVDHIEIIRGPGGATWGSNAVNGVVNIITKKTGPAAGLAGGGGGTEERVFGHAAYGGPAADGLSYRAWARHIERDNQYHGFDDGFDTRAGLRLDWMSQDRRTRVTTTAEAFEDALGLSTTLFFPGPPLQAQVDDRTETYGGYVNVSIEHRYGEHSALNVGVSYDRSQARISFLDEFREEFQAGFHHRFAVGDAHDVVWGAAYRLFHDDLDGTFTISFDPKEETEGFPSVFAQDEIALVPGRLKAIVGLKAEYNDATETELQPTLRISWTPDASSTLWAALSRAVRTPSRRELDGRRIIRVQPGAPNVYVVATRNPDFRSEEVWSLETGLRVRPHPAFMADLALFLNRYDRLASFETGPTVVQPYGVDATLVSENGMEAVSYGAELALDWRPFDVARLRGSYTFLTIHADEEDGSTDAFTEESLEGSSPRHQASVWLSLDLPADFQADGILRHVSRLPAFDVDGYTESDARLSWHGLTGVEIGLVGRNLARAHHAEFGSILLAPTDVERSAYVYLNFRF